MKPPTDNMNNIGTVLSAGPMTWEQIQHGLTETFFRMNGAVLRGILKRMLERGLITQHRDLYRLADAPPRKEGVKP